MVLGGNGDVRGLRGVAGNELDRVVAVGQVHQEGAALGLDKVAERSGSPVPRSAPEVTAVSVKPNFVVAEYCVPAATVRVAVRRGAGAEIELEAAAHRRQGGVGLDRREPGEGDGSRGNGGGHGFRAGRNPALPEWRWLLGLWGYVRGFVHGHLLR
jgi:hypothetical protein